MITLQPGVPVKNLMIYSSKVRKESISPWNGFPTKKNATNSILPIPVADNILDDTWHRFIHMPSKIASMCWKFWTQKNCGFSARNEPRYCGLSSSSWDLVALTQQTSSLEDVKKLEVAFLREFWDTWIFPSKIPLFSTSPQSCVFGDSMTVRAGTIPQKSKFENKCRENQHDSLSRTQAEKVHKRLGWKTLSVATSLTEGPNCLSWHPCCSVFPFGSHRIGNHPRTIHPIICNRVQPGRSQAADPAWLPTSVISELQRGDTPQKNRSCWMYSFFGHKFASREKP